LSLKTGEGFLKLNNALKLQNKQEIANTCFELAQ